MSVPTAVRTSAKAAATTVASAPEHERRLPGEPGLWIFIAGDTFLFALFFTSAERLVATGSDTRTPPVTPGTTARLGLATTRWT